MRDEEGFLYIVDRKKDMVITGGMNVYPREIEAVLDQHPGVLESAVIGAPDPRWGEQLVAYVVLERPVSSDDLAAYCRANLAPYKSPKVLSTHRCVAAQRQWQGAEDRSSRPPGR